MVLRVFLQWTEQSSYISSVWNTSSFIGHLFVLLAVTGQLVPCAMVILQQRADLCCAGLFGSVLFQRLAYRIPWHSLVFHDCARIGGLFLLLAEESAERRCIILNARQSAAVDKKNAANCLLTGKILLITMFMLLLRFEATFLQNVKMVIGFPLVVLVVTGYKTELSAVALVLWLSSWSWYSSAWRMLFSNNSVIRGWSSYEFFATLSVIGGLLMVVVAGPGARSLDAKKKYW